MKPTIGRIVHFHNALGFAEAALITHVYGTNTNDVDLLVFGREETFRRTFIPKTAGSSPDCWNWPERI